MTWALPIVILTIFIFVVAPLIGLYTFSRQRAEHVRRTEDYADPIVHRVEHVRLALPEIVRITREDRHPAYLAVNAGLFIYGWVVIFVRVPYASAGAAADDHQYALGISLLIGTVLTLSGAVMGKRFGRWSIGPRKIADNVSSSTLGDDIRVPYVLGWWGLVSTLISIGFYAFTVTTTVGPERLVTSMGGLMALMTALMCVVMVPLFISRIRRYISQRASLIAEAKTIIAMQDEA